MKTKKEVLYKHLENKCRDEKAEYMDDYHVHEFKAMDEYAKEVSIAFGRWLSNNCTSSTTLPINEWYYIGEFGRYRKTTEELFNLYLSETQTIK